MNFALNALFFSDDYIDKRSTMTKEQRDNFFYPLIEEFPKTMISLSLSILLELLVSIIIHVPKSVEHQLNKALVTKDVDTINEAQ